MKTASSTNIRFFDHDHLIETFRASGLAMDIRDRSMPLDHNIGVHTSERARIVRAAGTPLRVSRSHGEMAADGGAFLGIMLQKRGHTIYESRGEERMLDPGDLLVWHGSHPVHFNMPDSFQKVCMDIPIDIFGSVLPEVSSYAGLYMPRRYGICHLLGTFLSTLADDVLNGEWEDIESSIELGISLIGAALSKHRESTNMGPRTNIYQRSVSFIETHLLDPDLSPRLIAQKHHISTRYLHLIFSERGTTVAAWIKSRRLARGMADLANSNCDHTVGEIAIRWGFSDGAHFSRSFRQVYGMSPLEFRRTRGRMRR